MTFAQEIERWHGFFTLLGEVTASFAGLLFVSLSVRADRLKSLESKHLSMLARQTFFSLLMMTSLSLLAVGPLAIRQSLGGFLIMCCGMGLSLCAKAIIHERRAHSDGTHNPIIRAFYGPVLGYVVLTYAGLQIAIYRQTDLTVVAWGAIMLIITSARNAWDLLVGSNSEEQATN